MAHEIETMMYSGDTPWHDLGVYVGDKDVDSVQAIRAAELDWRVEKRPLFMPSTTGMQEIDTHCAIVRMSDESRLGVVGSGYGCVQNSEAFTFLDSLVEDGSLKYHTAGSLRNGQRVWILAKFSASEVVPGDLVDNYLLFWSTHDGSGAVRALPTSVRVVCANTARMALDKGAGEGIYVRHTSRALDRLDAARTSLGFAQRIAETNLELSRRLSHIPMTADRWVRLLEAVVPTNDKAKRTTRTDNIRDEIRTLAVEGRGMQIAGVEGTAWGALNAVIEFANYYRTTRSDGTDLAKQGNRFESSLFGSGADMIAAAKNELAAMAIAA